MSRGSSAVLGAVLLLLLVSWAADGVSVACMMAYDEGGAPAVSKSPECPPPQWRAPSRTSSEEGENCQLATLQGRRKYQEDRIVCNPRMKIRIPGGKDGPEEVTLGVAAVFDGHGGDEASKMASQRFLEYFYLNVVFKVHTQALMHNRESSDEQDYHTANRSHDELPNIGNGSVHHILQEALFRTIQDVDSEFYQEALEKDYASGSTVTAVLWLNRQLLVGHVGDSKALLCTNKVEGPFSGHYYYSSMDSIPYDLSSTVLSAEELTVDHHPDREDERTRIEAAGGFIRIWGVPRVNGILAVTRAIGDVYLKRYGVIADPEISGWRNITRKDRYIAVASDGIFERLTPLDVCRILQEKGVSNASNACPTATSLADCIVREAFKSGSQDNLSAVVIALPPENS